MLLNMQIISRKVRDTERISQIHAVSGSVWVDTELHSKLISKIVARDFHIVTANLFFATGFKLENIKSAILELENLVFDETLFLRTVQTENTLQLEYKSLLSLRIVSTWAARYYRCMVSLDEILMRLLNAEFNKKVSGNIRKDKIKNIMVNINNVKLAALPHLVK